MSVETCPCRRPATGSSIRRTRAGFAGAMEIDREHFGLTWNQALEAGAFVLGRESRFELDIEAVRQSDGNS